MEPEFLSADSDVLKYTPDLQRLYAVFSVPVIVHDKDHRVVSLNRAMSVLLNVDAEAVMGRRCEEVLRLLNITSNTCLLLKGSAAAETASCQLDVVHSRTRFLVTRYPVLNDYGNPVGGVCVFNKLPGISETDQESDRNVSQMEHMLDVQTDCMYWKDGSGRLQYVNRAGRSFFHFDKEDYRGKTDFEVAAANVLYRAFFARCASVEDEAWNNGRSVSDQVVLELTSHKLSTFEVTKVPIFNRNGSRKGMVTIARDITRQVTTEQELHSVINQLNVILDSISSAIALVIDRKIIWTNPAAEKLFGYSGAELQGCTTEILHSSRKAYEDFSSQVYLELGRQGYSRGEIRLRKKDGEKVWCLYSTTFVNAEDPSQGIIVAVEDIQAQKDAWEREQRLQEKMQHAQKLESLGVLAGGIAHDFNNLLMGILGNTELCLMKLEPESPLRKYIDRVRSASEKAADLTAQMLAYSGRGHFIIEPVNLSTVVSEMSELLDSVISKKARIVFKLDERLPAVRGDVSQMRQVVMNLIVNASEALEDRPGDIVVSTGVMEVDAAYLQKVYFDHEAGPGKYVWLEVSDTGTGMDSRTVSRIFEPFFTTKFSGRGLGLAAMLGIVRGHHGIIRVDSKPGRGTTVRVLFPLYDAMQQIMLERDIKENPAERESAGSVPVADQAEVDQQAESMVLANRRVLMVDDDDEVRDVARKLLENLGCSVVAATDGQDALDIFRVGYQSIDVVLLDLSMPDISGEEVLQQMRSIDPGACIVLSSGYSEEESIGAMEPGSADGFVHKPYTVSELVGVMTAALLKSGG